MKRILSISALLLALFPALCQSKSPVIRAYAYAQMVSPGTIPVLTDEKGNRIEPAADYKPVTNYYIYLETNVAKKLIINNVWVKGLQYSFRKLKVSETPVIRTLVEDNMKITDIKLVPKTRNGVLQILPETVLEGTAPKDIGKDEVVITYTWKGKTAKYRIKKIKVLAPQMSQ